MKNGNYFRFQCVFVPVKFGFTKHEFEIEHETTITDEQIV
ncbi:hypothetical protein LEP1GSC193_3104 [Leptospira alstonii serovar Pingchang str. 80-412]|uniref:Uncharacterized protein n=2 Tax=Leptospira alstonii TaxID=28452 RepID=M6CSR2_9LEPT|nr:hypothetical protein LEP1GSC194_2726 [Leptospira alstonii serovar Sichuan str. 79601]EQA78917.1 hypothetical protein LEP1GSC193_3104 [Leptospira alstonii serovar Pingchang str. 80-412]